MNKRIICIIGVALFVIAGIIIGINIYKNSNSDYEGIEENSSLDYEEELEDEDEKKKDEYISIGEELYNLAINMYQLNPYCGISFDDIDEEELVYKSGVSYYKTKYSSVDQISKDIVSIIRPVILVIS